MQALRCSAGHVNDAQFCVDSLANCRVCGDAGNPVNAITGEVTVWPAERAARKAAAKAAANPAPVPVAPPPSLAVPAADPAVTPIASKRKR